MRKGRDFELLYEQLYKSLDKEIYTISSPAYLLDQITNQKREIDVLIEYKDSNNKQRRISIECRDRNYVQDVLWIEQLITKKNDLNIDITIATTTSTFTEPAIKKANSYGIILETAQCINAEYISEMTKNKFVTFTFMYSKVTDICFLKKNQSVFTKNQIKENFSQEELKGFEDFLDINVYRPTNPDEIIKEAQRLYKCRFLDAKPFPVEVKANIEKEKSLEIYCNGQKITDIIIKYFVQPIQFTIPIIFGVITKTPNKDYIKNQIAEYKNEGHSTKFIKLENKFCLELLVENKNPYLRLVEVIDFAITPFEIIKDSTFNMNIKNTESLLGKLDFTYLWK